MLMKTTRLLLTLATLFVAVSNYAQGPNDSGTYYANADGKKGAELKTALCAIINPHTQRSYANLWTDFKTTDAKSNGKVWDMYSIKREMTFGTDQAGSYSKEGDVYNREHSFPKSWFNDEYPMYTDLYHLYPTDGYVNGRRSNYPFGETNGEDYKSDQGFSKLGACTYPGYTGKVFEPNDLYKGDFARTYFYMVTAYETYKVNGNGATKQITSWNCPMLDGKTYPGLSSWALSLLMEWSKKDPVSEDKEIPRVKAVYGIQKNRNPFIDYPGLEEYIWGKYKDYPFSYDNYQKDPTGIVTVTAAPRYENGVMYNMAGQVVDKSYKGLVIMNGRKFVNK